MKSDTLSGNKATKKKKSWLNNIYITLDNVIHAVCFISVLLIGADIWGIDLGINIRFDQFFLCALTILLIVKDRYYLTWNVWIVVFAISAFISAILAYNTSRGLIYYLSVLYNIFFLFYAFKNYVRWYGIKKFIAILRMSLYVQFVIMMIQVLLLVCFNYELPFLPSYGYFYNVPRFSLWFYEPSYLTTYLSFWFALAMYMFILCGDLGYIKDVVMSLLMFLFSTSTTGYVALFLVIIIVYIMWLARGFTLKKLWFPLIVLILFLIFRFAFSSVYELFFARLFNQSLDEATGGRVSLWSQTWEVFINNPLFGVGPGNYGLYIGDGTDAVPSNVTLDLLSTLGIFATIAFYGLTVSLCVKAYKINRKLKSYQSKLLVACALGLLIFTVILQVNQGYLRLYHWMFFGIISGGLGEMEKCSTLLSTDYS